MATRRQRSRMHANRVQHQLGQRERLRSALTQATEDPAPMRVIAQRMGELGYEQDGLGGWQRKRPVSVARVKRGPVVSAATTARRKLKRKRKGRA